LGIKRNLPELAEKYLQKLLAEHPESSYVIQMRVKELQAELDKDGLQYTLINKIDEIHAKHPHNPDLRKLIVRAAPLLLKEIDRVLFHEIKHGRWTFAEQHLNIAASWNVSSSELAIRRKKFKRVKIDLKLKEVEKYIAQGHERLAEEKLNEALNLGADSGNIEKVRRKLPLSVAKKLIESGKFEEAGEMLLELELEGKYSKELPELYTALRKGQNQRKWDRILAMITETRFFEAEHEIEEWKNGNPPVNLSKLKEYLQQEKTEFTQQLFNKRREQVRSLIDNNKGPEAKRELAQWEKTGEDRSELLKLAAYFRKHQVRSLIDNNKFTQAKRELNQWETTGEDRQEFWKLAAYFRKHQVRSLIDNNKFTQAKMELSRWEKTGEDQSELLKLTTYLRKHLAAYPGTVFDRSTGLMWQKKSDGVERNWQNAKGYCEDLLYGGYSDWKLPGGRELRELQKNKHILDPYKISGIQDSSYWTSDAPSIHTNAFIVNFDTGDSYSSRKHYRYYVRCVRGGN
jgi:hypothetical protein